MNNAERRVLRRHHTTLIKTLDTKDLIDFLFEKEVVFEETFLDNEPCRSERVKKMLIFLKDNCSFELFLECLRYDNSYPFIADELEKDLGTVDVYTDKTNRQRRVNIFTDRRKEVGEFRHKMKRFTHGHDFTSFQKYYEKAINDWFYVKSNRSKFNAQQSQKAADFCYAAYDAEVERRRVFDEKIELEGDILDKLQLLAPHTSCPCVPEVMYLARYSSALVMAGGRLEDGLSYIEDAEHKMEMLPPCRETGLVLYIKFNIMLLKHERDDSIIDKAELSKLGKRVIAHFSIESETISSDFRRIFLLKKAHLCLNMGVYLKVIGDRKVIDVHIEEADKLLKEVRRPQSWSRMEVRANMVYNAVKSRLTQLKDSSNRHEAIRLARRALRYAVNGKFPKEKDVIQSNLDVILKENNHTPTKTL